MFLPVLLVRDFGVWGFVVFALPNIVGAAAMGWHLTRGGSLRLIERHAPACRAFSLVTIMFQAFFGADLMRRLLGSPRDTPLFTQPSTWFVLLGLVLMIDAAIKAARPGGERRGGVIAWAVSAAALVGFVASGAARAGWEASGAAIPPPSWNLMPLGLVCVLGFVLCPPLDLTFHRALHGAPNPRAAFTLGFGVLFALMIAGTMAYAGWILLGPDGQRAHPLGSVAARLLMLHIVGQLLFTAWIHTRAFAPAGRLPRAGTMAALVGGVAVAWGLALWAPAYGRMEGGEVVYRVFMAFYGLVFPAYVLLCILPTRDGHSGARRDKLLAWAFAVGAAAPMYWMGFIQRQTWWLLPGVAVVLMARAIVSLRSRRPARADAP
jgi:hypothetical protein